MGFSGEGAASGASAGMAFGPWGALAGGVIGGFAGGSGAGNYARNMRHAQERAIASMKRFQKAGMFESEEFFNLAMEELQGVGPAMRQELLASGEAGLAQEEASAIGTGLSGTTAMRGAKRAMRRDVGHTLGLLEERIAGSKSALYQSRGLQLYQEYIDRANIFQRTKWDTTGPEFLSSRAGAYGEMGAMAGGFLGDVYDWYKNKGNDNSGGGLDIGEGDR